MRAGVKKDCIMAVCHEDLKRGNPREQQHTQGLEYIKSYLSLHMIVGCLGTTSYMAVLIE